MKYKLLKDVIELVENFELNQNRNNNSDLTIESFKKWIVKNNPSQTIIDEPYWEGKENGRSAESAINTLIVHMNRYAKSYSKSAIIGSEFSSQEDFIYLINLKAFGEMSKMDLIKKNVHEKPVGIQVINRLIAKGWVTQEVSIKDKRSKVLKLTIHGNEILNSKMDNIRKATKIVTGDLEYQEKMELIRLLNKLNVFHKSIYDQNISTENLLDKALKQMN